MTTKNELQLVCIAFLVIHLIIGFFIKDKEVKYHHLTASNINCAASFKIAAI